MDLWQFSTLNPGLCGATSFVQCNECDMWLPNLLLDTWGNQTEHRTGTIGTTCSNKFWINTLNTWMCIELSCWLCMVSFTHIYIYVCVFTCYRIRLSHIYRTYIYLIRMQIQLAPVFPQTQLGWPALSCSMFRMASAGAARSGSNLTEDREKERKVLPTWNWIWIYVNFRYNCRLHK